MAKYKVGDRFTSDRLGFNFSILQVEETKNGPVYIDTDWRKWLEDSLDSYCKLVPKRRKKKNND